MRTSRTGALAVAATVVVGIVGLGAGRADAAPATRVTRSSRAFGGFIDVLHPHPGSPPNFTCQLSGSDTRSVTATIGTTNIGAGRSWTCRQGTETVTLRYSLVNTAARFPNLSTGRHQFTVSYTANGTNVINCGTVAPASTLTSIVTETFVNTERRNAAELGAPCPGSVFVQFSVGFVEGWNAT